MSFIFNKNWIISGKKNLLLVPKFFLSIFTTKLNGNLLFSAFEMIFCAFFFSRIHSFRGKNRIQGILMSVFKKDFYFRSGHFSTISFLNYRHRFLSNYFFYSILKNFQFNATKILMKDLGSLISLELKSKCNIEYYLKVRKFFFEKKTQKFSLTFAIMLFSGFFISSYRIVSVFLITFKFFFSNFLTKWLNNIHLEKKNFKFLKNCSGKKTNRFMMSNVNIEHLHFFFSPKKFCFIKFYQLLFFLDSNVSKNLKALNALYGWFYIVQKFYQKMMQCKTESEFFKKLSSLHNTTGKISKLYLGLMRKNLIKKIVVFHILEDDTSVFPSNCFTLLMINDNRFYFWFQIEAQLNKKFLKNVKHFRTRERLLFHLVKNRILCFEQTKIFDRGKNFDTLIEKSSLSNMREYFVKMSCRYESKKFQNIFNKKKKVILKKKLNEREKARVDTYFAPFFYKMKKNSSRHESSLALEINTIVNLIKKEF